MEGSLYVHPSGSSLLGDRSIMPGALVLTRARTLHGQGLQSTLAQVLGRTAPRPKEVA